MKTKDPFCHLGNEWRHTIHTFQWDLKLRPYRQLYTTKVKVLVFMTFTLRITWNIQQPLQAPPHSATTSLCYYAPLPTFEKNRSFISACTKMYKISSKHTSIISSNFWAVVVVTSKLCQNYIVFLIKINAVQQFWCSQRNRFKRAVK